MPRLKRSASGSSAKGPTPERIRHADFEKKEEIWCLVDAVKALYKTQDIGDEEVAAAERWRRDYLFAATGVVDLPPERQKSRMRGDRHTWMFARGHSAQRISQVRETLGLCAHVRLEMMLTREMPFSVMARYFYPEIPEARARMKVSAQCALLLEQLTHFYAYQRKKEIVRKI